MFQLLQKVISLAVFEIVFKLPLHSFVVLKVNNSNSNSIDYSNTSIDNYIAKNSLTKNKSSILLGVQASHQLNDKYKNSSI